ncbi:patatin-like phospholipase family protein [Candidatus Woesearchaeota archaeon]|nr:patatin-like phospholipase family protein [Candidatus Woesearchaeota archaeon]
MKSPFKKLFRLFRPKKVGLALGSGGARGFAHLGVIKVLLENNIPIDYISGSSIGSIVAAYYALNLDIKGLEDISLGLKKRDMLKFIDLNNPSVSILRGNKVKRFLEELFEDRTFKDTKIPLRIGATALEDGKKVVFKEGKLVDAIMASGAFPGVFPVVTHNGKHLVDGGLADALPIDMVEELGADVIIGVDIYNFGNYKAKKYGMREVLERTYQLLLAKLSNYEEKSYKKNVVVIRPVISQVGTFDFFGAEKKIKIGVDAAKEALPKIQGLI